MPFQNYKTLFLFIITSLEVALEKLTNTEGTPAAESFSTILDTK